MQKHATVRIGSLAAGLALACTTVTGLAPAAQAAPPADRAAHSQVAVAAVPAPDLAFLLAAHDGNVNEITAGRLALEKATDPQVRQLAALFIEHHTMLEQRGAAVAAALGVTIPDQLTPQTQRELDFLRSLPAGPVFDRMWSVQQLNSHGRAMKAGQLELATGQEPAVRALAAEAAPYIEQHYAALVPTATRLVTGR
ncbi:DUF4142 domain-containing protein [Motilibacter deserti]|uniref:DUF4142 domain-containing protein n=1 Tax=Motilibacter deserti TaxID=2714956 RepID=A0ABX0GXD1_9ACTN|nr:DUF4142 domain-containing protein [Motilibacter deserti]NHC14252.1 DUF4142 domain-containing protein [Motilibacter deserti]